MQKQAYRSIAFLLGLSLLAVLLLQGYWLNYLYRQEQSEINRLAYSALNNLTNKLNEQENLLLIKQRVKSDTFTFSTRSENRVIVTTRGQTDSTKKSTGPSASNKGNFHYRRLHQGNSGNTLAFAWNHSDPPEDIKNDLDQKYSVVDSLDAILDAKYAAIDSVDAVFDRLDIQLEQLELASGQSADDLHQLKQTIEVRTAQLDTALLIKKEKDLQALLKKLETEIKLVESDFIKQYHAKPLQALLQSNLRTLGINSPVECAIEQRQGNSVRLLSATPGFQKDQNFYETDLSRDRFFQKGQFLLMQFSDARNMIFSRITRMLILALVFTLLMVGVFYASLHLLMKQKKLSEIRNDFVNNMTHELKTPIATISLAADALVQPQVRNQNDKFNEYIRILKEENNKLNSHVERVLQMALLEKEELKLNKTRINLKTLSEEVIQAHRLQANALHAEMYLVAESDVWFNGDPLHLTNALGNLIDNALKYGDNKPIVFIQLKIEKNNIVWQVQDNGPGMAGGELEKIFDKFYRIQKGALHEIKGFGLGLSYVKSIVEAHGGTISVQSEPGKGSTFTIQFKFSDETSAG